MKIPIPSNFNIALLFFGIAMIVIGVHLLIKKDAFKRDENGKMIAETLNLSEKARKIIYVLQSILIILVGLFVLINSILYINGIFWFFQQG